jgi:2-phosphosulfolactate phosphatase
VVARATAEACVAAHPRTLTLIASADHPEDHACARYVEGLIRGEELDLDQLLEPLRASERYARLVSGSWPGCPPSDVELSLTADRFDFAMPVSRGDGYLVVRPQRAAKTSSTAS